MIKNIIVDVGGVIADNSSKKFLNEQYRDYQNISDRICELYPEYSEKKPHETNAMNKAMTWYGIEMKTLMDKSSSKIAELIIQGTNMGIIEGRKLLNHKDTTEDVEVIAQDYVQFQENALEKLKKFL